MGRGKRRANNTSTPAARNRTAPLRRVQTRSRNSAEDLEINTGNGNQETVDTIVADTSTANVSIAGQLSAELVRHEQSLNEQLEVAEIELRIIEKEAKLALLRQNYQNWHSVKEAAEKGKLPGGTGSGVRDNTHVRGVQDVLPPDTSEPRNLNAQNVNALLERLSSPGRLTRSQSNPTVPSAAFGQGGPDTQFAAASNVVQSEESREPLNLQTVRTSVGISQQVEQALRALGLFNPDQTSGSSCTGHRGNDKRPVSGRNDKLDTGIVRSLVWPQSRLEYEFAGTRFEAIDFGLLVAGEASVIAESIGAFLIDHNINLPCEALNRLELLKKVGYHFRKHNWWKVKQFFAAALTHVERGRAWESINYTDLANTILFTPEHFPRTGPASGVGYSKASPSSTNQTVVPQRAFCGPYTRGDCDLPSGHNGRVNGRFMPVEHFCPSCKKLTGQFLEHVEIQCENYKKKSGLK